MRVLFAFFCLIFNVECYGYFNRTLKQIKTIGACTAQLDDGSLIDLRSLDSPKNPRTVISGQYKYTFNPCSDLDCGGRASSVCQQDADAYTVLGQQTTSLFTLQNGKLQLTYFSTFDKSFVQCVCVSGDSETFIFKNESPQNSYNFIFQSKCCCPNGCQAPPATTTKKSNKSKSGTTAGTILTIIFFLSLTVYCVGGVIFMKFKKDAKGIELIPNIAVWQQVTSDIKGGFKFVVGKARPRSGYQSV